MPNTVFKGKAQLEGVAMTLDVVLYKTPQARKVTQQFAMEVNQDEGGHDCAWMAKNEKYEGEITLKLMSSVGNRAAVASGAVFLTPLQVVTITQSENALWNTTWQVVPGTDIDEVNSNVAGMNLKLQRYKDATQNTLAATTPS